MTAGKNRSDRVLCSVSRASAGLTEYLIVSSKPPTGYYVDGVTACPVSRALAGLTTEYLIVSSKPPTGYYVDGVTACPVSRASAGWWGLQRSECGVNKCGEALRSSLPQIPSSTRTNDPTSFDHPHTENDRLSSTQQISIF